MVKINEMVNLNDMEDMKVSTYNSNKIKATCKSICICFSNTLIFSFIGFSIFALLVTFFTTIKYTIMWVATNFNSNIISFVIITTILCIICGIYICVALIFNRRASRYNNLNFANVPFV